MRLYRSSVDRGRSLERKEGMFRLCVITFITCRQVQGQDLFISMLRVYERDSHSIYRHSRLLLAS
jgi:hypothetical protein